MKFLIAIIIGTTAGVLWKFGQAQYVITFVMTIATLEYIDK